MMRDAILTSAQKLEQVSLIYRTEPALKKWETEAQKCPLTGRGIRRVSPGKEKEGYDGEISA